MTIALDDEAERAPSRLTRIALSDDGTQFAIASLFMLRIFDTASGGLADRSSGIHRVGTRAITEDGRVFHYARSSGAAIVAGNVLQVADLATDNQDLAVGTEVLGSTTLTVVNGATAAVEGEFAGGYALTNSGTLAAGLTLPIASHPAAAGAAALVLTLDAPNPVLFHADTTVTMVKSPWGDVVVSSTGQDQMAAGVSNIAVTAGTTNVQYFLCQTWGVCAVLADETSANGAPLVSGGSVAGATEAIDALTEDIVGKAMELAVDGDFCPTFLTIAP